MSIRVVVADDHRLFREALASLLENEPDLELIGQADGGRAAIEMAETLGPDVLVLDIAMPDMSGLEVVRRVRTRCAGVKLVALSGYADKRFMQEMSKAGASGYIVKDSAGSNLARVIRAVAQGQPCWPPEIGIEGQSAASDRPL